jgi:hypothetical protein
MVTTLLLFGVTGMTGKHVLASACSAEDVRVVAFVRRPDKIPAEVLNGGRLEIVKGDCRDATAVAACIRTTRPDGIILTTNVGFSNDTSKLINKTLLPVVIDALCTDGRQTACRLVYLSGNASMNPPIDTEKFNFTWLHWCVGIKAPITDNNLVHNILHRSPVDLNFVVVKMGMVGEGTRIGTLKLVPCPDDYAFNFCDILAATGVKFCEVATLLVKLALTGREAHEHSRQFFLMDYEK